MHHCPRCYSEEVRRSKRRGLTERYLLSAIALKPFRCENCRNRFFRWPNPNGGLFTALWPDSQSSKKHQPFFL